MGKRKKHYFPPDNHIPDCLECSQNHESHIEHINELLPKTRERRSHSSVFKSTQQFGEFTTSGKIKQKCEGADCYGNNPFEQDLGMVSLNSMHTKCPDNNCYEFPSPGKGKCCDDPEHSGIYVDGCIEGNGTKCNPLRIKIDCLPSSECDCPSANFDCEVSGETKSLCDWVKDHEERIDFIEEHFCELVEECLPEPSGIECTVDKLRVCDYIITPETRMLSGQVCVTLPESITANNNSTSNIGDIGGEMSNFQVKVALSPGNDYVLYQGSIPPYTISRSTILNNLNTALLEGICDIEITETGFCVSNPQVGTILAIALNYISGAPGNFCNGISFTSDKTAEPESGCYYDTVFRYIKTENTFQFQIEDSWYDATKELIDNTFQRLNFFKTISNYRVLDANQNIIETNPVQALNCEYVPSALPICDYIFSTKNQTKCFTITFDELILEGFNTLTYLSVSSSTIQSQENSYIFFVDFTENPQPTNEEFLNLIEAGFYDFQGRLTLQRNGNVFTVCDTEFDYTLNLDLYVELVYSEALVDDELPYDFNPNIISLGGFYLTDIQDFEGLHILSAIYNPDFAGIELNDGEQWIPLELNENGEYSIFQTNEVYPEYQILYIDETSEIISLIPTNCEEAEAVSETLPICDFIHQHEHRISELEIANTTIQESIISIEEILPDKANTVDLKAVAFSNDYNDLDNKPTIPNVSGFVPYVSATQDVDLGTYKLTADAIAFDLNPTNAPDNGQIVYDGASGALAYKMNGTDVVSKIGQTLHAYVHNAESVQINKGQVVYLFGASGNKASVKLAFNTSDATSAKTFGLAAENIAAGQNGFVITQGVLDGLNTGSYLEGDTLYLGAIAGTLTKTKPYAPNHLVYIGVVERANNGNGQIYVRIQNGYELDEIHDVDLITTPPVNNDLLTYKTGTNNLWKPQSLGTLLGGNTSEYVRGDGSLATFPAIPTNNNQLTNGAGYITSAALNPLAFFSGTAAHTGNTNETIVQTISVASTAWDTNAVYQILARVTRIAGTVTFRVRFNTTPDLTGTPISILEFTTTAGSSNPNRLLIKRGNSFEYSTLTTISDLTGASTTATATVSTASTTYIMLTIQGSTNAGNGNFSMLNIARQ